MRTFYRLLVVGGVVLLSFWGCGGDQNIQSLIDLKAPATVRNPAAFPADQKVRLTWTANTEAALVGYNVYRSTSSSQGYTQVGSTGINQSPYFEDEGPDLNGDGIPDGLVNNIRYFYKITAFDRNGRESTFDLAAVVNAIPGSLPAGTQDLEVINVRGYAGNSRTIITWDLNLSSLVYGYNIYRNQVGENSIYALVAIVPQGTNYFADTAVSNNCEFIYQVAPITRELAEGRRTQSRTLRVQEGDSTVPKPPGSDTNNGSASAVATDNGIQLAWGRPTQNTDGTIIGQNNQVNDLVGGGFIIKRGNNFEGEFKPVGIVENIGTELSFSYVDPFGTSSDYYIVTAFDVTGNESAPSDVISVNNYVPAMVQGVDAFASSSIGQIVVTWNASAKAVDGYRVYRSESRDSGYAEVSGLLANTVTSFTDADSKLETGKTYWYKVQAEASDKRGSLSTAASATPGPSSGIFYLEGEDATVTVSNPLHFAALSRQSFPAPFSANGVLFVQMSASAVANTSFAQLDWLMDIDATGGLTPIVRSYDVYLITVRNSSSGIFGLTIKELLASTLAAPYNCPGMQVSSKDFFRSTFGYPPVPSVERIGALCFPDEAQATQSTLPVFERIVMTLSYQGYNSAIAQGVGELYIDALVLVRR